MLRAPDGVGKGRINYVFNVLSMLVLFVACLFFAGRGKGAGAGASGLASFASFFSHLPHTMAGVFAGSCSGAGLEPAAAVFQECGCLPC